MVAGRGPDLKQVKGQETAKRALAVSRRTSYMLSGAQLGWWSTATRSVLVRCQEGRP